MRQNCDLGTHSQYEYDRTFFERIDTERKAYWLGFIQADGCVSEDGRLRIGLAERDADHLQTFLSHLNADYPVRRYDNGAAYVAICGKKMCEDLMDLGIIPQKTGVDLDVSVPFHLERHYWRGLIDGDGCICISKGKGLSLSLCGDEATLERFRAFVHRYAPFHRRGIYDAGPQLWNHSLGVRASRRVLPVLYENATVALPRKRAIYESIFGHLSKTSAAIQLHGVGG